MTAIDLNDYFYFVHVVEKGGFSAAAKALGMPKSRLSRHIAILEERLDTRLIQRTTRQFNVTEIGGVLYQHARALISRLQFLPVPPNHLSTRAIEYQVKRSLLMTMNIIILARTVTIEIE